MFRTAMSLEEGYKDKGEVIQNASDRQTDRETEESAGQGPSIQSRVRQLLSVSPSLTH